MPGYKRPPAGHVSLTRIADRIGVDRRVLKRLYEASEFAGVRAGGVVYLDRRSLAAYLWSRPRCVREDCGRRVIGDGPGCDRHRRSGRHHSDETKRRMSEIQGGVGPVEKVCEWCGKPFVGRGARFCGKSCSTAWQNKHRPDAGDRQQRLQEGHGDYRALVERVKAERGLLDVDEVLKRLRRAGVPRTAAAISGHIRNGWLEPERGLGFDKPYLFTAAAVDEYIERLRSDERDKRLLRYDKQPFRGDWTQARHGSTGGYGLLNAQFGHLGGPKPTDLGELTEGTIRRMRAEGKSLRAIEAALAGDATLWQIRRMLGV